METTGKVLEAVRQYVADYDAVPSIKQIVHAVGLSPAAVRWHIATWFSLVLGEPANGTHV